MNHEASKLGSGVTNYFLIVCMCIFTNIYRLQYPDWTAFALAALMLSCLGTAIYLLDIYRHELGNIATGLYEPSNTA